MNYCSKCGHKLIKKECGIDGLIPFCTNCNEFRFYPFNSAISTVVLNPTKDKILLIKQYGKDAYILVAGYIMKGDDAKQTLIREVKEEINLNVIDYLYNENIYYKGSNTLMHNYISVVDSEDFKLTNEVDEATWFTFDEALKNIKPGSLAEEFLQLALKKIVK